MTNRSIGKAGKVAITLGIVAGVLSLSRALYTYFQYGHLDIGKIALAIGVPCLVYVIVRSAASAK